MFVLSRWTNAYTHHNLSDFFQTSANGFRNLCEEQRRTMFFDFQGQNVLLRGRVWGSSGILHKLEVFSRLPRSSRAFWVLVGPKRTPNNKVMTVLMNTCPFYGSLWKKIIFSWRVMARRPKSLCPSLWRYCFHIYIDRCQECPLGTGCRPRMLRHATRQKQGE